MAPSGSCLGAGSSAGLFQLIPPCTPHCPYSSFSHRAPPFPQGTDARSLGDPSKPAPEGAEMPVAEPALAPAAFLHPSSSSAPSTHSPSLPGRRRPRSGPPRPGSLAGPHTRLESCPMLGPLQMPLPAPDAPARCRQPLTCLKELPPPCSSLPAAACRTGLTASASASAHCQWLGTGDRSPSARSPLASISLLASCLRSLYRQPSPSAPRRPLGKGDLRPPGKAGL